MSAKSIVGAIVLAIVTYCWIRSDGHFDPKSIENQRILVTGASSGIGEELAYQYAKLGARLVITARRQSLLEEVANKCQELGAKQIEAFPADMGTPEDRDRLIKFTQKTLGGLDQLILNHATFKFKMWVGDADEDLDTLRKDLEVNFMSFVDLASKALPMLRMVEGRIGVVSSITGKIGMTGFSFYASTKFALQGFFSSFRQELDFNKSGVSVTICVLGLVDTETSMNILNSYVKQESQPPAASVMDTAQNIIKGVNTRLYEVYYPYSTRMRVTAGYFFPEYLDRLLIDRLKN